MLNHIKKSKGKAMGEKKGRERKGEARLKKSYLLSLTEGLQWDLETSTQLIHVRPGARPGARSSTPFAPQLLTALRMGTLKPRGPMPGAELHRAFATCRGRSLASALNLSSPLMTPGPPAACR